MFLAGAFLRLELIDYEYGLWVCIGWGTWWFLCFVMFWIYFIRLLSKRYWWKYPSTIALTSYFLCNWIGYFFRLFIHDLAFYLCLQLASLSFLYFAHMLTQIVTFGTFFQILVAYTVGCWVFIIATYDTSIHDSFMPDAKIGLPLAIQYLSSLYLFFFAFIHSFFHAPSNECCINVCFLFGILSTLFDCILFATTFPDFEFIVHILRGLVFLPTFCIFATRCDYNRRIRHVFDAHIQEWRHEEEAELHLEGFDHFVPRVRQNEWQFDGHVSISQVVSESPSNNRKLSEVVTDHTSLLTDPQDFDGSILPD